MVESEERFLGLRPCGIEVIQPAPECPARPSLDPCDYNLAGVCIYCRGYQPAPPPAPVVVMERGKCGNCGEEISGTWDHYAAGAFTCHKAAPAPVASENPEDWLAMWRSSIDGCWYACKRLVKSQRDALEAAAYEGGETQIRAFKIRDVEAPQREQLRPILDALRLESISTRKAEELLCQWSVGDPLDAYAPAPDEPMEILTGDTPAPVASELPDAVTRVAGVLREFASSFLKMDGFYAPSDAHKASSAADALEAWARSLSATSGAQFPKVREALTTFRTMNHHHHQGSTLRGCNSSMIDAAIAELDAAQAVPVEAIRYALSYLRSDTTKTNLLANIDTIDRWLAAVEGGR